MIDLPSAIMQFKPIFNENLNNYQLYKSIGSLFNNSFLTFLLSVSAGDASKSLSYRRMRLVSPSSCQPTVDEDVAQIQIW